MAAVVPYALLSLVEAKDYLGVETTSYDDLLTLLINAATTQIEKYCNQKFVQRAITEAYNVNAQFIGTSSAYNMSPDRYPASTMVMLQAYPVVSITSIADSGGNTIANTSYFIDAERGILRGYFPNPYDANARIGSWTITYTAGRFANTAAVSGDLKLAALKHISTLYYRRGDPSVASKTIGDASISYRDMDSPGFNESFSKEVLSLLSPYINRTF